jgi:CxxC-x17-CxxC domain-containing protein
MRYDMNEQQQDGLGRDKSARRFGGGSPRPRFGGQNLQRERGGGGGRQTQLFSATCSDCRKPCEVPFRPSGDKPVYCKECFMKRRGGSPQADGRREGGGRDFGKRGASLPFSSAPQGAGVFLDTLKRQMDALSVKLDIVLARMGGDGSRAKASAGDASRVFKSASKKSRKPAKTSKKK